MPGGHGDLTSGRTIQRPTESLSTLPALNLGWVDSLICIGSPVRGFRPVEALRFEQEKVPKPTSRTSSPRFSAPVIVSNTLSTAREASPRLSPVVSATAPISSCLFIDSGPLLASRLGDAPAHLKTGPPSESKGKRVPGRDDPWLPIRKDGEGD